MAEATLNSFGVFGDKVYTSTDLNRRAGEVLNRAREHPVTISRNNEQFALFPREQAAKLVRTVNRIGVAVELLGAIHDALSGGTPSISWVRMFEKDDLEKLFAEVLSATRDASIGRCDWDHVAAVIHEWQESALVAKSGVLDTPMHSEFSDESPLPHPAQVKPLDKETELEE